MNCMNRIFVVVTCGMTVTAILAGCGPLTSTPKKAIAVPSGGKVVLTAAERAGQELQPGTPSSVALAAFETPIEEPQLLKPLEQWTEQEAAADALGRIGAAAVPSLIAALESPDAAARQKAVGVLGRMGSDAAPAVPHLINLLNDPDPAVRKASARTLGRIGPAAKDAVPNLMQTLLEPTSAGPER